MFNFRAFNQGKIIGLLCVIQCVTQCLSKLQCVTQYTVPVKIGNLGLPEAISPGVKGTYCTFITSFDILWLAVLQQHRRRVNLYTLQIWYENTYKLCLQNKCSLPRVVKDSILFCVILWVVTKSHLSITPSIYVQYTHKCRTSVYCPGAAHDCVR